MANKLGELPVNQLLDLVKSTERSFDNQMRIWQNRRKIRFRDMERELLSLPLSNKAGVNGALMVYQTEEPNQEVHRRVNRLIANKERVDVIVYESDDGTKAQAQEMKDALKALLKWMKRGKIAPDITATEYQQADGLAFYKLDFVADFADDALKWFDVDALAADDSEDDYPEQRKARKQFTDEIQRLIDGGDGETYESAAPKAYKSVTHAALRRCDPPFRLSAPDPLSVKFTLDGDTIDVVVEKGKRALSSLLANLNGHNVRLLKDKSSGRARFVVFPTGSDVTVGDTIPENDPVDGSYEDQVDFIEIRTRDEIVYLMRHPKLREDRKNARATVDDYAKITFENPFGPYSTGYVLIPGLVTGSHDPAHRYQPAILGTLNVAQAINVLTTIRISAAIDAALAPPYIEAPNIDAPPTPTTAQEDKTPTVRDGKELAVIPGKIKRQESPNIDLDKAEVGLAAVQASYRFNEVLAGDAESSDSGHKLAIQVSQADTQLVPFQNARAAATAEVLMCCLYATKKHGLPIYVKEVPDQSTLLMNRVEAVQPVRAITPAMFDMDFNLIVTIGSETPVTKFAKWAALESRYKAGTLSYETLMEQSDVENVADEIARVFEGQTLVAVMQQAIPVIVQMISARAISKIIAPNPGQVVGQGGNANGGGMSGAEASTPVAGAGRLPGVGMAAGGPTDGEEGPRVQRGAGDSAEGRSS